MHSKMQELNAPTTQLGEPTIHPLGCLPFRETRPYPSSSKKWGAGYCPCWESVRTGTHMVEDADHLIGYMCQTCKAFCQGSRPFQKHAHSKGRRMHCGCLCSPCTFAVHRQTTHVIFKRALPVGLTVCSAGQAPVFLALDAGGGPGAL